MFRPRLATLQSGRWLGRAQRLRLCLASPTAAAATPSLQPHRPFTTLTPSAFAPKRAATTGAKAPARRRKRTSAASIAAAAAAAAATAAAAEPLTAATAAATTTTTAAAPATPATPANARRQKQLQKQMQQFRQFQLWQREQERLRAQGEGEEGDGEDVEAGSTAAHAGSDAAAQEGGGGLRGQRRPPPTARASAYDEQPAAPAGGLQYLNEADEVEMAAEVSETARFAVEEEDEGEGLDGEGSAPAAGEEADDVAGDAAVAAEAAVEDAAADASAGAEGAATADSGEKGGGIAAGSPLLGFESPLNLRLATLTRHHGKAFRAIAVYMPLERTTMNFTITFEDIASGSRLVCKLDDVASLYSEWATQFRASFIALFLPTLQHPNATLLMNAITTTKQPRPLPPSGSYHPRRFEDADHIFFSYSRLREVISKKRRDVAVNPQLLTVAVLNAYAEEWKNFITAPLSCAPQPFLQAAFNFHPNNNAILNKELLHAQLTAAAEALLAQGGVGGGGAPGRRAATSVRPDSWSLIFVSAPPRASAGVSAVPPMQDLLTGQFVEPLSLSERHVVYIIGSGTAAQSFAQFPVSRKGRVALSVLLQDIESQLALPPSQRNTLTVNLALAVDTFSRMTWLSLLKMETGALREPHPPSAFYRLERRAVQSEIVPAFLESVFSPSNRLMAAAGGTRGGGPSAHHHHHHRHGAAQHAGGGGAAGGGGGGGAAAGSQRLQSNRRLEEHVRLIYNNPDRLEKERGLREQMRGCRTYFIHIATASVTAARRADNPFSSRNGVTDVSGQLWSSLTLPNPPPMLHAAARVDAAGNTREFVDPDSVIPADLPTQPHDHPVASERAENAVLIAWDVKRVILFLRDSPRLREFLYNGGRIWCAQYAQYLLKGFNHLNLATMERTLLQYHDGPLKTAMHPLAKLKLIYETQLDVAVNTRQLNSILHRMDGLLASTEMEVNGLQLAPQGEVSRFANTLRLERERLERVLQEKILDFTKHMDDDVRKRINFRSPQDISTIIYGGGLCRHLGSRFVPVRPTKYPITALLPHAMCHATGTPTPEAYSNPESLLGTLKTSASASGLSFTASDVERTLRHLNRLSARATLDQVVQSTAVVVVIVKTKLGGLLEQISIYVPSATEPGETEINVRVAIDEVLPVSDRADVLTVSQLKAAILTYAPLLRLRQTLRAAAAAAAAAGGAANGAAADSAGGGGGRRRGRRGGRASPKDDAAAAAAAPADLRNLLIITSCAHDRLEPIVDTGVVAAIQKAVFGDDDEGAGKAGASAASAAAEERPPFERVCFGDMAKVFPAAPQGADSFASDFSELSTTTKMAFSARGNWDTHTKETIGVGGVEGVVRAMVSHCASLLGTPRDPLRNSHPVPSAAPRGLHGQEQASTPGMLWMVTPPNLHPVLRRFLKGRAASSGADAMERVTVFLSPYKEIDLTFFTALQQLRYTEKKLQLFEEGALFRAVLPECEDRVHGELCHCVTATGRLSSQSPNLQNIPREEDLRTLLRSRFGAEGRMIEADYSQLEVVVLAALSRDAQMMQELRDQVDFHCLRVSLMTKEPYEDIVRKAKVEKDPQYIQLRQQAKVFSFQRQYGAGVATIATTTGLTEHEVERLIVAEEQHYKDLGRYYRLVTDCVAAGSDRLLRLRTLDTAMWDANTRRIIMLTEPLYYFVVATGSKFDFAKDRKSVPRLKNYPVQGLAGEIVQIICGKIIRLFYAKRNYGDRAFLVNTVHDCVWVDAHESVAEEVKQDLKELMGSTQQIIGDLWPEMGLDVPFKAEVHDGITLGQMS